LLQDCGGDTVFQIPVPCSYDLRVASSRYLAGLDGGPIPLRIVFNGTVFRGAQVEHLPEDIECKGRLSTQTWREAMDACFPDHAWIRVDRETFEALRHYAVDRELYGSSEVISDLLRRSRVGQT
jgi:hypothetical protein